MIPLVLPLIAAGVQGASSLIANSKLQKAQAQATRDLKTSQANSIAGFQDYQSNIRNLISEAPKRKIDETGINDYVNKSQNDYYASQGRASGYEAQQDLVRQNTADQTYRASQAARSGMDLLGAIGQISSKESQTLNLLGGQAEQARATRIDNANSNLSSAILTKSNFRQNADMMLYNDQLNKYNQGLSFEQSSGMNLLNMKSGFDREMISQKGANASAQAAGIQGFGQAIGGLVQPLMAAYGNQQTNSTNASTAGMAFADRPTYNTGDRQSPPRQGISIYNTDPYAQETRTLVG